MTGTYVGIKTMKLIYFSYLKEYYKLINDLISGKTDVPRLLNRITFRISRAYARSQNLFNLPVQNRIYCIFTLAII